MGEKKFTVEDMAAAFQQGHKERYHMTGCFYKVLLEAFDKETADQIVQKAYFAFGHLKHHGKPVVQGDVLNLCKNYTVGENDFIPADPGAIPYELVSEDKAVIQWAVNGEAPCAEIWMETGLTREQACGMCANAAYGDIGYADLCGLDGYMTKTICAGDPLCEFVVERRKG